MSDVCSDIEDGDVTGCYKNVEVTFTRNTVSEGYMQNLFV